MLRDLEISRILNTVMDHTASSLVETKKRQQIVCACQTVSAIMSRYQVIPGYFIRRKLSVVDCCTLNLPRPAIDDAGSIADHQLASASASRNSERRTLCSQPAFRINIGTLNPGRNR